MTKDGANDAVESAKLALAKSEKTQVNSKRCVADARRRLVEAIFDRPSLPAHIVAAKKAWKLLDGVITNLKVACQKQPDKWMVISRYPAAYDAAINCREYIENLMAVYGYWSEDEQ